MPSTSHKNTLASYVDVYKRAVTLSSADRWPDLTVNLDIFSPFKVDKLRYAEDHVCINMGSEPARLKYVCEDGEFVKEIRPREFLVTPAGQPVWWELLDPATALSVRLQPRFMRKVAESELGMDPDCFELLHRVAERDDEHVYDLGKILHWELQQGKSGAGACAECMATVLAVHLLRHHSSPRRPPPLVDRVRAVIESCDNPFELTLELLVHRFKTEERISVSGLSRRLAESGESFRDAIALKRLEFVTKLFKAGMTPVQVAQRVHKSPPDFCKFIKEATGLTPSEFQASLLDSDS